MSSKRYAVHVDFTVVDEDDDSAERLLSAALDNLGFDYQVTYVQEMP